MRGDERRRVRISTFGDMPQKEGDVWRLARNSGAFRVERLGGGSGGSSVSRVHEGPACRSSVHG